MINNGNTSNTRKEKDTSWRGRRECALCSGGIEIGGAGGVDVVWEKGEGARGEVMRVPEKPKE